MARGVVSHASAAQLHWADLTADEQCDRVTSPVRTVLDGARTLPFPEVLGIADGFLRRRLVTSAELSSAAERRRGAGRTRVLRVVQAADCTRYDELLLAGWWVLRFAWEHVVARPDRVRASVVRAVEQAPGRARLP